jgi:hypothetical protein
MNEVSSAESWFHVIDQQAKEYDFVDIGQKDMRS